jgi:NAD(P)-dependent dehydrogenase (short-subunit alcohol dehydrogenase family)
MTALFNGEVVLVTGGGSGIGRATALAFAKEGARVAVAGRHSEEAAETANLIQAAGGDAISLKTDVKNAAEVEAMVAQVVTHYGALDIAFNNAGIEGDPFVALAKYSESTWDDVIETNLKGVFLCMKYELPHIVKSRGAIVNMASVAGLSGGRLGVAYYASKHGVVGLTRAAAHEYAAKGVRINAVAPAVIQTAMAERAGFTPKDPAMVASVIAAHPMGRIGAAEEVANAVIWLCSKGASFTTGHTLPVDGGYMI